MSSFASTKTQKVYLVLKDRILNGEYGAGKPLPGEPVLASHHEMSRITIRRALAQLEREGLVQRRQGVGTFATPRYAAKPIVSDFADLLAALNAMGKATTVSVREFSYLTPREEIADALRLDGAMRAQYSVRIRFIENQPFSYLRTWLPEAIGRRFTELDLEATPLHTLLERNDVRPASARQNFSATLATPETASALDVDVGSALIFLTRTIYDETGAGIEHLEALYRPDRYTFEMQLERGGDATRGWTPMASKLAAE